MRVILLLAVSIGVSVFLTSPSSGDAVSDFESGTLEGWAKYACPGEWILAATPYGNPGYCMEAIDTGSCPDTQLVAVGPGEFTGDLSVYSELEWDEYVPDHGSMTKHPTIALLVGWDGTRYTGIWSGTVTNTWHTRSVPLSRSCWNVGGGSLSFEEVLSDVIVLGFYMETNTAGGGAMESRIDNVRLVTGTATEPTIWGGIKALYK